MKNMLEKGIVVGLLAFGISIIHADIAARHGGQMPSLIGPAAEAPSQVRYLSEPRKTSTLVRVKHKKGVKIFDLKGGIRFGGSNLTAMSDSMQTSGYVGAGRAIHN